MADPDERLEELSEECQAAIARRVKAVQRAFSGGNVTTPEQLKEVHEATAAAESARKHLDEHIERHYPGSRRRQGR